MLITSGSKRVKVVNQKVQLQANGNDCGLFALASSTDICHGLNPMKSSYEAQSLRRHLVKCIKNHNMLPFLCTQKRVLFHKTVKT